MKRKQLQHTKDELVIIYKERFTELELAAGTAWHLHLMIGVHFSTVQGWAKRGRISKAGATLVGGHPSLGIKFTANYLRPDL